MTATTQARPRLWPLGIAIAVCLIFAVMFLGGGATKAHSAVPRAGAPLADTVTVTETAPPPPPVTVTSFSASPIFTDVTSTKVVVVNQTSTHTVVVSVPVNVNRTNFHNVTDTRQVTQVNQLNSTAFLNVNVTNTSNVSRTVVNTQQLTKNVTSTAIVTGTDTASVTNTTVVQVQAASKPKGLASRARLAIGAGGVAVTSAAGFGFLMLRRRGRYTA